MNFKFTKTNIILIVFFLLIIFAGLFLSDYRAPKTLEQNKEKITLVKNYGRFFSVGGAGNKYVNFIIKKDEKSLIALLSDDYIKLNNITTDNVLEKIPLIETHDDYDFEARKMFQEQYKENIIRYYIMGHLTKMTLDEYSKPSKYYLIIDYDIRNNTFAVTPYNGDIFKEED